MNKWMAAQTALVDIVYDLAEEMNNACDYAIVEESISLMDSLTTIIKRMGEANIYDSMAISQIDTKEGEQE